MKYALFHVLQPEACEGGFSESISVFEEEVRKKGKNILSCKKLLPGFYECALDEGLSGLMWLVLLAQNHTLQTRVLLLETAPSWIVTPLPDKKEKTNDR